LQVGVLAERLLQNPRQPAALPSDFVRYDILPRMRRDLARRPSRERRNGRQHGSDTGRKFFRMDRARLDAAYNNVLELIPT
jgi:hypothetical protein